MKLEDVTDAGQVLHEFFLEGDETEFGHGIVLRVSLHLLDECKVSVGLDKV